MGFRIRVVIGLIMSGSLLTSCAHTQLRWNTVKQGQTLSAVYQNQVLNNLAKFVSDPHALPDFSLNDRVVVLSRAVPPVASRSGLPNGKLPQSSTMLEGKTKFAA